MNNLSEAHRKSNAWVSFLGFMAFACIQVNAFAQSGKPPVFSPQDYTQRTVWVPYWSERANEHSTLHLRNGLHHFGIQATIDIFLSDGTTLTTLPVFLERLTNVDYPLEPFLVSRGRQSLRSGSIRIT